MVKPRIAIVALGASLLVGQVNPSQAKAGIGAETDRDQNWRAAAAQVLATRADAGSLATAAALTYPLSGGRARADTAKAAAAALDLIVRAGEFAPDKVTWSWLRLQLCVGVPACDVRDAATTMRWVDADNGAVWMATLASAQKDKDATEIDRVLADMALGNRFDLYTNRTAVLFYDSLNRVRDKLPGGYLPSDLARLNEAVGLATAETIPSFSPLINACRDASSTERRDDCLKLSRTLQRADTVMAQLVGLAIARRLAPVDSREFHALGERRHALEWLVATANEIDSPLLPWMKNARARARLAKMRALPREEDVDIALLREHHLALQPPEDRR